MTKLFVKAHMLAANLRRDVKGVSTIEYAALAFGIIAAVGLAVVALSGGLSDLFSRLNTRIGTIS